MTYDETEAVAHEDAATRAPVNSAIPARDDFGERMLESMKESFWDPEVERRGGPETTGPIYAALAILLPGVPVEVRLNGEVEIVARAREGAAIERGDLVTVENLDEVEAFEPVGVDPNAGWVAWLVMPDGRQYMQFDLLRNRGRSLKMLALARDFLATAQDAVASERRGPAVENAMAAAELAITARTYSFEAEGAPASGAGRNRHSARQHWTKVQVGLGNTTPDAHDTLLLLHRLRGAARYGEGDVPERDEVRELLESVGSLVEDAALRIGPPLRTQDPSFLARLAADAAGWPESGLAAEAEPLPSPSDNSSRPVQE